jgi:hypothetical protein
VRFPTIFWLLCPGQFTKNKVICDVHCVTDDNNYLFSGDVLLSKRVDCHTYNVFIPDMPENTFFARPMMLKLASSKRPTHAEGLHEELRVSTPIGDRKKSQSEPSQRVNCNMKETLVIHNRHNYSSESATSRILALAPDSLFSN